MAAKKRIIQSNQDHLSLESTVYNAYSGSKKVSENGRHHLPIPVGSSFTTSPITATALPSKGVSLAVYNNASTVGSITLGTNNTVVSAAPGAVDANGNASIPCKPNDWTFIACYDKQWVISSAATILVFIIADDSTIQ